MTKPPRLFASLRINILLVFSFSFALRYLFLHMFKNDPFFLTPMFDAEFYDRLASTIADGTWPGDRVFFVSPLYAYFLAALYVISHHDLFWIILAQFFLGAAHCVLIYLTGRKLFGDIIGIISALIASLYGFFIFTEGQLLKSSLAYFLSTLSFYLYLLCRERQRPILWGGLGVSLGLTALVIPNVLVFVPLLYGVLIFERNGRKGTIVKIAGLSLGLFATIAPVTLRNYYVGGDMVLISSNGGINLFLGTDPQTEGGLRTSALIEQAPEIEEQSSRDVAERALQRRLKPSEVSRFWSSMAIRNIANDPSATFLLLLKKIYIFWNWRELTDNLDFYYFREKYRLLGIPFLQFGTIAPLAFLGMWLSRRPSEILLPVFVFIIVFTVSSLPFPIFGRYRTPIVPFLMILAACALYGSYLKLKQKGWKDLAKGLSLFVITFAVINSGDRGHNFSFMHRAMGEIYIKKGDFRNAASELEKAVSSNQQNFNAHNALGFAYLQMGRDEEAIRELETAIRLNPGFVEAHNTLALAYAITGNRQAAEEEFKKVRELDASGERSRFKEGMIGNEKR